jgi:hypothetical protein
MSTYIEEYTTNFEIEKENVPAAFAAAKELFQSGNYCKFVNIELSTQKSLLIVWKKRLTEASSLDEFLQIASGWEADVKDSAIIGISAGEYFNYEDFELFQAIAPYVKEGSWINISTSDTVFTRVAFEKFQWYFDGNTCIRKEGELDFDSNIEIVEALLTHKKMLPMMIGIHPELDKRIHEALKGKAQK